MRALQPRLLLIPVFLLLFHPGRTQNDPTDPLRSAFRVARRADLRNNLPPNSCAVVFSGGFRAFSTHGVIPRPFDPDPDFYYLTGLRIPDAVLVVFSEPFELAEGKVDEALFLPGRNDLVLRRMGEHFTGEFETHKQSTAIRPATQWRKFCIEVLGGDRIDKVFSFPFTSSDFRKRGDFAYIDLGSLMYANLSPGFPFDPPAQRLYREIVAADSAAVEGLILKVNAYLNYFPRVRRDPILDAFSRVTTPEELARLRAQIEDIRIDIVRLPEVLGAMRSRKSPEEVVLLRKAAAIACEAVTAAIPRAKAGSTESGAMAAASYVIHYRNARPAMPVRVASGPSAGLPFYNRNDAPITAGGLVVLDLAVRYGAYCARISRTVPADGVFDENQRALYASVANIHTRAIGECKPGTRPTSVTGAVAAGFEALFSKLDIAKSKGGRDKVLALVSLAPIGLDLNELDLPGMLMPGMVFELETAVYIPGDSRINEAWRNSGVVLRDVVLVTPNGPEVLTSGLGYGLPEIEKAVRAPLSLPSD